MIETKLKAEVKEKWVEALRSGKYQQGRGHLCKGGEYGTEFCCLGVLADLYFRETGGEWINECEGHPLGPFSVKVGNQAVLSDEIVNWAFISPDERYPRNPEVYSDMTRTSTAPLATLNDAEGKSFTEIAALIAISF